MADSEYSNLPAKRRQQMQGDRLPLDVITEILMRLPARTIVRFRRVCKVWCATTSDTHFIDAHLKRASKARPPNALLFAQRSREKERITVLNAEAREPRFGLSRTRGERLNNTYAARPCNGILCLFNPSGAAELVNPATGESLTLPESTRCQTVMLPGCCLGFDPVMKRYKVLRFYYPELEDGLSLRCEIYTVGTRSWRQISGVAYPPYFGSYGVAADGVMYWISLASGCRILTFALSEEKFGSIAPPMGAVSQSWWGISQLRVMQGHVCLVMFSGLGIELERMRMDVWMLDEDSKHAWTHKYSIQVPLELDPCCAPKVLFVHKEKILLAMPGTLRYYSIKGEDEDFERVYDGACDLSYAYDYVGSLVLL